MTPEVQAWAHLMIGRADIEGKDVLEVGSLDVNGSVRPYVQRLHPRTYVGVDIALGERVDEVVAAENLVDRFGLYRFDVVISTEMLEHAEHWRDALWSMMAVTAPSGLMFVTTRSPGFGRHDWPGDFWRYTMEDLVWLWAGWFIEDIRPDRTHPGVFIRARKPHQWDGAAARARFDRLTLTPAPLE
jgi:hypothetical protein